MLLGRRDAVANSARLNKTNCITALLFVVLAGLLIDQAWLGLMSASTGNVRGASLIILSLSVVCLPLGVVRLRPAVEWFLLLIGLGLLTLPAWASILLAILISQFARTAKRAIALSVPIFLSGFISELLQGYGFGGDTLLALLQTHLSETIDFALSNLHMRFVVEFMVQMALLGCFVAARTQRAPLLRFSGALVVFGVLSVVAAATIGPARDAARFARQFPAVSTVPAAATRSATHDLDVVLILGESTTRSHLQIYGYPYPTTPRLSSHSLDLVRLTDAISTYSHTVQSISSLMYRPSLTDSSAKQTLLGELKAAKVRTKWLSSQATHGPWDTPVRLLASDADETRYFHSRGVTLPRGLDYHLNWGNGFTADQDVADALIADLSNERAGPSLTVAHLTAGHFDYCRNIPHDVRRRFEGVIRGAKYFGDAQDRTEQVNCYDAAMTLVDDVVGRTVDAAKQRIRPTVVIFAPDHGEDPDGGTGHSSAMHSARHVEIPIVFYFNGAAQHALSEQYIRLQQNQAKSFALPWLHESILDLFGLNAHFSEDPSRSILWHDYRPIRRLLFPEAGALAYDEFVPGDRKDYLSNARLVLQEVAQSRTRLPLLYSHRNNSELALLESMQSFAGVEMDVVFEAAEWRFVIRHPPAESTGYTLERALEVARAKPTLRLWLDWKLASADQMASAVEELERLDRMFGIKHRTVVETTYLEGPLATLLSDRGFRHSYYLQPNEVEATACNQSTVAPSCLTTSTRMAHQANSMRAAYISFDRKFASLGEAIVSVSPQLKALTWDTTVDASKSGLVRQLVRAPEVEVQIIRLPTRYSR